VKHLYKPAERPKKGKGSRGPFAVVSRCGKDFGESDEMVEAALHSDCDECRVAVGVARVGDQMYGGAVVGVRQHPVFKPQPMVGAESVQVIRKRRSGE
jgi:hypothetical protein